MVAFIQFSFVDAVDILMVAILLFGLYQLLKGTAAIKIFLGIVAIYLGWKLVSAFEMRLLTEIFGAFISVGFIALIVVFQPEIRTFLFRLGDRGFISQKDRRFLFWKIKTRGIEDYTLDVILKACKTMAKNNTGALIVITRQSELVNFVDSGEKLNAIISSDLLENIFFRNSPLHDGAVIIRNDKIVAARCILPVSKKMNIPAKYGLRHRAGVGVTEQTDAISVIVSEENGKVSIAKEGKLFPDIEFTEAKKLIAS